jgi:hypothetical protein
LTSIRPTWTACHLTTSAAGMWTSKSTHFFSSISISSSRHTHTHHHESLALKLNSSSSFVFFSFVCVCVCVSANNCRHTQFKKERYFSLKRRNLFRAQSTIRFSRIDKIFL